MTIAVHVAGIVNVNHVSIVERVMSDTTSELRQIPEIIEKVYTLAKQGKDCTEPAIRDMYALLAAQRQRWEAAARSELFMALIATAETVGALDAHDIERMRQAALDGERGKERI